MLLVDIRLIHSVVTFIARKNMKRSRFNTNARTVGAAIAASLHP